MEEEEFVISSWQRSDSQKELNEAIERRSNKNLVNNEGKENMNLNSRLLSHESRHKKLDSRDSEDEEVTLDDDTLLKLIEGDLHERHEDLEPLTMTNSRPKPKPRLKGLSSADRENLADDLFLGEKDKLDGDHHKTSPHPVPRPRSKPVLKDSSIGIHDHEDMKGDAGKSPKLSADKLFDAVGKGKKSVSFENLSREQTFLSKGNKKFGEINYDGESEESFGNKTSNRIATNKHKFSPTKPARTRSTDVKKGINSKGDESGYSGSKLDSQVPKNEKKLPQKPQQNFENDQSNHKGSTDHFFGKGTNGPHNQHVSDSKKISNDFLVFDDQDSSGIFSSPGQATDDKKTDRMNHSIKEDMVSEDGTFFMSKKQGVVKEQNVPKRNKLTENAFEMSGDRFMTSSDCSEKHHNLKSSQNKFIKEDVSEIFKEHVPNIEGVVQPKQSLQKNKKQEGKSEAKSKRNTPLKAEKGLEEMTKSPRIFNFESESLGTPHGYEHSRGKGGLYTKHSSSLTNLNTWGSTQEDEDGLESWEPGYTSSSSIREAVFNEWLERKQKGLKEKVKKKVEEKKEEEEKLKQKQERESSAKKAFEVWCSKKEEVTKDKVKRKKQLMDKEIDAKRDNIVKKQDAKKFFESWKSKKDEVLKENYKEKKMKEKETKKKEIEEKHEKIDIAKKSYDKWKARKDEQLKEEFKNKKRSDKIKTQYEKEADIERRQECERTFQEFLRKKGTMKRAPPTPSLTQRPWCPGGLTKGTNLIPEKIQPVVLTPTLNRSRSFSGTTRATSFHKSSRSGWAW